MQWGVLDALVSRDLHLVLTRLPDNDLSDPDRLPRILREQCVDGLLINYTHDIPPRMGQIIAQHRIPAVWLNVKREHDAIYHDDVEAGRLAAARLLSQGYRRIAYADFSHGQATIDAAHYSTRDREAGYAAAMLDAGLTPRVIRHARRVDAVERLAAAAAALRREDRPDAVVAYASSTAAPFILAAMQQARPGERPLGVVTVDNAPVDFAGQPVEAVYLHQWGLGRAAVDMLADKIDASDPAAPLPSRIVGCEADFPWKPTTQAVRVHDVTGSPVHPTSVAASRGDAS